MAEKEKEEKPKSKKKVDDSFPRSEKAVVFIVAYFIAISLWLLVNLGREYTLTVELPIRVAAVSDELALAEEPPAYTNVSIFGEGWKLLNIYNNPPEIMVNSDNPITNLTELVQENLTVYQDITVQKVQPGLLNLNLEEKVTRKIPVNPRISLEFRRQHDFVGDPEITPDSVEIIGARSRLSDITEWPTKRVDLTDIKENIDMTLELEEAPGIISLNTNQVRYRADVSEYTEGEIRIYVRSVNLPPNREVRFSPSVISIKYDVPLEEFSAAQDIVPYEAYVNYADIESDTTGFVSPTISQTTDDLNLKLRSFQPRRVSYYNVIQD